MSIEPGRVDLRVKLLRLLKSREMYGYEIMKNLQQREGRAVHSGFLYGKLRDLEKEGLLKSHSLGRLKGPERTSYQITEQGHQWLKRKMIEALSTVLDFYSDYVSGFPPDRILLPLGERPKAIKNVVLVAEFSNSLLEAVMEAVMKRLENAFLYFVKPPGIVIQWEMKRSTTLDGTFSNIPLRDGFADILFAFMPPRPELPMAIREFKRVVTKDGMVRVFYPTALIKQTFKEPLSFSDFVTRARQDYVRQELVDEKELSRHLKKHFGSYSKAQAKTIDFFAYTAMARALP